MPTVDIIDRKTSEQWSNRARKLYAAQTGILRTVDFGTLRASVEVMACADELNSGAWLKCLVLHTPTLEWKTIESYSYSTLSLHTTLLTESLAQKDALFAAAKEKNFGQITRSESADEAANTLYHFLLHRKLVEADTPEKVHDGLLKPEFERGWAYLSKLFG